MLHGFWTHRDIKEKVFTFDDLLDIHEVIAVKMENEKRARESEEAQRSD